MSRRGGHTGSPSAASDQAGTSQTRLQTELEAERSRLRALLDSMIDPYVLLRPLREAEAITDFLVLDVNPAASGYADLPPEKLLDTTLRTLVPDLYGRLLVDTLARVADTGDPLVRDGITVLSSLFGEMQRSYDVRATRVGDDVNLTWRDVTDRVMAAEALLQSEQRFRLLAENSTDVVFRGTPEARLEWVSPSIQEVLGFTPDQLVGRRTDELLAPEDVDRVIAVLTTETGGDVRAFQARFTTAAGGFAWLSVTIRAVVDNDGAVVGYVGSARDVETEHRAVEEAQYLATHDELTHLINRRAILARLDAIVQHPPRQGGRTAVLYLDLDGLKPVNDLFGHAAGDAVLLEVGRRLQEGVRSSDAVGRLGGDEFVVVLGAVPDTSGATAVAHKLRDVIREPIVIDDLTLSTTASIGIAFLAPDDTTDTVMARADAALYTAKRRGKDQVQLDDGDDPASPADDGPQVPAPRPYLEQRRRVQSPPLPRPSLGAHEDDETPDDDPDVPGSGPG